MKSPSMTRRNVMKATAGAAALAAVGPVAYAQEVETLKVGLIGCGNRGRGAMIDIVRSSPGIEVTALADIYPESIEIARNTLTQNAPDADKVTDATCFVGLNAYQELIASDVDIVLCAAYPHFRPKHTEAAVNAGKHVFAEKPIAVDPVGVRRFRAAGEVAAERGLGILAGTQRRHAPHYQDAVAAVHDGAIGKVSGGAIYFCRAAGRTPVPREEGQSDMEWMFKNWWWHAWLSGDMIGQLVIHQIDTMHWIMGGPCKSAYGFGGCEVYREPVYGNIFDHFSVCLEYEDGSLFQAHTRQTPGTDGNISGTFTAASGRLINAGRRSILMDYDGNEIARFQQNGRPFEQEHTDFVNSIRAGEPLNEANNVADSTLMSIMGQLSAYTGKKVTWDWALNESQLDLTPESYEEGPLPPRPVPGRTPLV